MDSFEPEKVLNQIPNLNENAQKVSRGIHSNVLSGGHAVRKMADLLHGTWLGHPLHPVLTDFTIGAWLFGGIFDVISLFTRSHSAEQAADRLTALGVAGAVPTALAGIVDYTTIPRRAISTGAIHGILNTIGLGLYLISLANRKAGRRGMGIFFSSLALGGLTASAWLGGELVYKYKVGVNKATNKNEVKPDLQQWTPALDVQELSERQPHRVVLNGHPVLFYRDGVEIYAIGAVCGHDGGPLDEGRFFDRCVECPWHQSVYNLRDGSVVHGPTTYALPAFETRVSNGQVEIRLKNFF